MNCRNFTIKPRLYSQTSFYCIWSLGFSDIIRIVAHLNILINHFLKMYLGLIKNFLAEPDLRLKFFFFQYVARLKSSNVQNREILNFSIFFSKPQETP